VLASPWSASASSVLQAISRDSSAVWALPSLAGQERVRACYVSLPLEWELRTRAGPYLQPILYLSVWSCDRWGMRRAVGYAFCHLPREPGAHELELACWAPQGSVREQMAAFFLGAAHPLDDVRRVGVPSAERMALQGRVLNRLGGPVLLPAGTIQLRLELVQIRAQSEAQKRQHTLSTSAAEGQRARQALQNLHEQAIANGYATSSSRLNSSRDGGDSSARDQERQEIAALRQRSRAGGRP